LGWHHCTLHQFWIGDLYFSKRNNKAFLETHIGIVRFPTTKDTGDTAWHIDSSFPSEDSDPNDCSIWRENKYSRDRALLMLFLFSDVDEQTAPTRIRLGSHLEVARILAPVGEQGLTNIDLSSTTNCPETLATGAAGTVYLCHPFLVHADQINRGCQPRFMTQPSLYPVGAFEEAEKATFPIKSIDQETSVIPIEEAVCRALRKPTVATA
jgi:hypothetical protein